MTSKFFLSIILAILAATALAMGVAIHRLHVQERALGLGQQPRQVTI